MNMKSNQQGFITMIIMMVIIIAVVVGFAYLRVRSNQGG